MITWHTLGATGLQAVHKDITIQISPISDDTGRVCLHVVTHADLFSASVGWIKRSVQDAVEHSERLIERIKGI